MIIVPHVAPSPHRRRTRGVGHSTAYHLTTHRRHLPIPLHHAHQTRLDLHAQQRQPLGGRSAPTILGQGKHPNVTLWEGFSEGCRQIAERASAIIEITMMRWACSFESMDTSSCRPSWQGHGSWQLEQNHQLQILLGCRDHVLLTPLQLKERFPGSNLEDIVLGRYGAKGQGRGVGAQNTRDAAPGATKPNKKKRPTPWKY